MEPERFCLCLLTWLELGLLKPGSDGLLYGASVNPDSGRVDLEKSELLKKLRHFSK
jgi:hypothetical protein